MISPTLKNPGLKKQEEKVHKNVNSDYLSFGIALDYIKPNLPLQFSKTKLET